MSEQTTPETDGAEIIFSPLEGDAWVPASISRKLERERDEAQKKLSSIHRWIERNHADGFIDSLTYLQNLERVTDCWYDRLDKIERERDEAQEKYDNLATEHMLVVNKLCNERDEARAAIPTGEWVAYEDHKKVHDAASRLLVAINKQLPIGSFTLILPEYYVLKDAIYGK
jgi:hypothetical protein